MLKGVKNQVIEIKKTDNPYIQRAILIINPEKYRISEQEKQYQARKYAKKIIPPCERKKYRGVILDAVKLSSAAAVGAGLAVLILR